MASALRGATKMKKRFDKLTTKTEVKLTEAGIRAGLTPLARAMRFAINATGASKDLKKAARATIGKSFKRRKGGGKSKSGKAGFGVGKPSKKKSMTTYERTSRGQGGAGLATGVGVSSANIHWFVLGTTFRRPKTGPVVAVLPDKNDFITVTKFGRIVPPFKCVIAVASKSAKSEMLNAARSKVAQVLARETAKLRK